MDYNITPIVEAIIALATAIISIFVVPFVKNKVSQQDMQSLLSWVEIAVKAAEQLYTSTDGEKKKQYVLTFLANKGYRIDDDEIDKAIEAAVLDVHNKLYGTEKVNNNGNS